MLTELVGEKKLSHLQMSNSHVVKISDVINVGNFSKEWAYVFKHIN